MGNRWIYFMTGVAIIGIALLLFLNVNPSFFAQKPSNFISLSEVRGSSVTYKGKPFTLNYKEQTELVDYINRSTFVQKKDYTQKKQQFSFEKITLYLFNKPDVEIFPIDAVNQNLILNIPAWNREFYFIDLSGGYLLKLINSAFDP